MDSFRIMLDQFILHLVTTKEKAVVHCSAGIGRTGTTIALSHLIINLWAQKNAGITDPRYSVFSTVRRLRWCRFGLVQAPEQYYFIYKFMAWYLGFAKFL